MHGVKRQSSILSFVPGGGTQVNVQPGSHDDVIAFPAPEQILPEKSVREPGGAGIDQREQLLKVFKWS